MVFFGLSENANFSVSSTILFRDNFFCDLHESWHEQRVKIERTESKKRNIEYRYEGSTYPIYIIHILGVQAQRFYCELSTTLTYKMFQTSQLAVNPTMSGLHFIVRFLVVFSDIVSTVFSLFRVSCFGCFANTACNVRVNTIEHLL